jgi:hypothetical protein
MAFVALLVATVERERERERESQPLIEFLPVFSQGAPPPHQKQRDFFSPAKSVFITWQSFHLSLQNSKKERTLFTAVTQLDSNNS